MTAAAIASAAATTATAHVNHAPLCHVATSQPLRRAATSLPTHHAAKAIGVMHHVVTSHSVIASVLLHHAVIVQRLRLAAISPLSPHVVMLPAAIVLSAVTASVTLHRAVISLLSRLAATNPLAANAHAATILTQAHAQIAPPLIVLLTQVSQHARPVTSRHVLRHPVAKPLRRAATVQHALARHVQAHHVPQPVHAAALTLTAVAVKATR